MRCRRRLRVARRARRVEPVGHLTGPHRHLVPIPSPAARPAASRVAADLSRAQRCPPRRCREVVPRVRRSDSCGRAPHPGRVPHRSGRPRGRQRNATAQHRTDLHRHPLHRTTRRHGRDPRGVGDRARLGVVRDGPIRRSRAGARDGGAARHHRRRCRTDPVAVRDDPPREGRRRRRPRGGRAAGADDRADASDGARRCARHGRPLRRGAPVPRPGERDGRESSRLLRRGGRAGLRGRRRARGRTPGGGPRSRGLLDRVRRRASDRRSTPVGPRPQRSRPNHERRGHGAARRAAWRATRPPLARERHAHLRVGERGRRRVRAGASGRGCAGRRGPCDRRSMRRPGDRRALPRQGRGPTRSRRTTSGRRSRRRADRARAGGPSVSAVAAVPTRDRERALCLAQHGEDALQGDLPQARRRGPQARRPSRPRPRSPLNAAVGRDSAKLGNKADPSPSKTRAADPEACRYKGFSMVAGAGFEPATFGL